MKKTLFFIFFILISSACYAKAPAKLIKVLDGDTLLVNYQGKEESVRLLGIDCYETSPGNRAYKQAYTEGMTVEKVIERGRLAKLYVQTLVKKNDTVRLEFEAVQRDKYNRLLAYVYLDNGKMINKELLKHKFAKLYLFKNTTKSAEFLKIKL